MDARLVSAAEAVLRRAGLLNKAATVLVALSGGADSVALLLAMLSLAEAHGFAVRAAHVEHGLRGEASQADATFCQALCKRHGVPLTVDHARLNGDMNTPGVEAAARDARYRLLFTRARECQASALLLAHHQDDQAETVLQHLLRGSGARGLRGMEEISQREGVTICRPLLSLPKQTLLDALGKTPYRTDESNLSPAGQRNRLRQEILPQLEAENPGAVRHIAQSAALCALDEACLQSLADQLFDDVRIDRAPYFCLRKERLLATADAITLRVLRRFAETGLRLVGADIGERSLSADDSLALLRLLSAPENTVINLPGALHALGTASFVHLTRMEGDAPLRQAPAALALPLDDDLHSLPFGDVIIHRMPHAPGGLCPDGKRTVVLPRRLLSSAVLRHPQSGDIIQPFGAGGTKLLRRYLSDKKLDQPFRQTLPVVASGRRVLWAIGVGAAEETRISSEPSVLLTLQGELPWISPLQRSKP